MYFSYFARAGNHPEVLSGDLKLVSIAIITPQAKEPIECDTRLAPSRLSLNMFKKGAMTREVYSKNYIKNVKRFITAERILELYKNCVLCCYEAPDKFCHRQVLRSWIKSETGVYIPELKKHKVIAEQINLFEGG